MQSHKPRRPRRTPAQWQLLVERQAQSGLSAKAFCQREALGYKSFMRWRMKYHAQEKVSERGEFVELTPVALSTPVRAAKATPSDCVMELRVGDSVTVRIYAMS